VAGTNPYLQYLGLDSGENIWIEVLSLKKITGLVAAYNMIPSPEGVLVDISGNGNNGIIKGAVVDNNGMFFSGVPTKSEVDIGASAIDRADGEEWSVSMVVKFINIGSTYEFFLGEENTKSLLINASSDDFAFREDSGTYNIWNGLGNTVDTEDIMYDKISTLTFTCDGANIHLYFNGVYYGYVTPTSTEFLVRYLMRNGYALQYYPKGTLYDVRFYNYHQKSEEAIDYHNSFQKLTKRGNFSLHPVGSTI
jgi:hypothetical protein